MKKSLRIISVLILCMGTIQANAVETNEVIAQQSGKTITGTIVGIDGEPIIGANIQQKGQMTNGTVTDVDGKFSLTTPENATLVISYIGYITQEIAVKNKTTFNITLLEDSKALDEVVVIGYGTVAKRELTSAVSHVSSKDFLSVGSNNAAMQIQGKVAGVSITNVAAADPNSDPNIQVRGVSSRKAGLGPLIVIDGVPGGNLQNINDNDIESIDVLKDGAASSIYGTRGSNGVIMVTTKKGGSTGAFRATYTGYVSFDVPKKQLKVLSADEFRQHLPARGADFGGNTDWFDEITQTGVAQNHTLQLSGGNAKNNYRATVDVRDATGIDIRSDRREIGARLSINHTSPNDLYKFTFNVAPRTISKNENDRNMFWQALTLNPTFPVMDPDNPQMYYEASGWEAQNPVERFKVEKKGGDIKYLDWDGTFRLNLLPLFAPDGSHALNTQITLAQQLNDFDDFWFRPSTSTLARKNGYKGEAWQEKRRRRQESLEWLVNYGFEKNNHNLKVMGGYSYQYFQYTQLKAENKNFTSDLLEYNKLGDGTYMSDAKGRLGITSEKNDSKLIAFFGRISYDYQGKYLATASLRYEGSSKFGKNNKWGYFPAVSAGWRISEEGFMKNIEWLNDLKLRADYGVTGNQDFDNYKSLSVMKGFGQAFYDGRYYQGWSPDVNRNEDLSWEKGKNMNIGLDFSIFKDRISGSINYYNRKQEGLLGDYNVPVPPNIQTITFANVGVMRNTGFEFDINFEVIKTKDFNYNLGVIASSTNNRFVSFSDNLYAGQKYYWLDNFNAPGSPGAVQRIDEGERVGNFYTFKYAGVDENGNWMVKSKDGTDIPIAKATDEDKRVVGNGLPKYSLSLTNSFRYKKFDLNLFFRGNFGYQVYDVHNFYWGLQSAAANLNVLQSAYKENAHIVQGMNQHNSYFVKDAGYLKLAVTTLGYTHKASSKWIESFRIYFTGQNLLTFTKFKGVDPDVFPVNGLQPGVQSGIGDEGNKKNYYPSSRQYLIGLQLNF